MGQYVQNPDGTHSQQTILTGSNLQYQALVTRHTDFAGKTAGQSWDVPHVAPGATSVANPTAANFDGAAEGAQSVYSSIATEDGTSRTTTTTASTRFSQQGYRFDILSVARRTPGIKNAITVSELIQILKSLTVYFSGFGSGMNGATLSNGATLRIWNINTSAWDVVGSNATATASVISATYTDFANYIDSFGYVRVYAASAYPSDGTTASSTSTDYIKLEMTMFGNLPNESFISNIDEQQLAAVTITAGATTSAWSNLDISRCSAYSLSINPSATHTYSTATAPVGRDNVELVVAADRDVVIASASQGKKLSALISVRTRKVNVYITNGDTVDRTYYGRFIRAGAKGERVG